MLNDSHLYRLCTYSAHLTAAAVSRMQAQYISISVADTGQHHVCHQAPKCGSLHGRMLGPSLHGY